MDIRTAIKEQLTLVGVRSRTHFLDRDKHGGVDVETIITMMLEAEVVGMVVVKVNTPQVVV